MERAKKGLGKTGRFAVDAYVGATQMGADAALGAATGGGAMVPMLARSFGGGVQEAREKGYDVKQQTELGLTNAATEYFTEKLFGGNPVYDGEKAGLVNRLAKKVAGNKKLVTAVSSLPSGMVGEGLEEVAADILEPIAEKVVTGNWEGYNVDQIIEDGAIGMLLGGIGQGGQYVANGLRGTAKAAEGKSETQARQTEQAASGKARNARRTRIKADTDIEAENISRGEAAINRLFQEAETADNPENLAIEGAMYRSDLGPIDFKWGRPGTGQKFKHGFGLAHLFAKRNAETGNGREVANKMAEVIAKATDVDIQHSNDIQSEVYNARLHFDGYTAVLAKKPNSNHWLLTGWEDNNEAAASATGEVHDSSGATAATPTRTRRDGGYAAAPTGSIPSGGQIVNISSYTDALRDLPQRNSQSPTPYTDAFRDLFEDFGEEGK